jgi:hypothetical protein
MLDIEQNLRYGYFPLEIPKAFSSKDFALAASSLKATPPKQLWTACTPLNLARAGGTLRRRLGLPNPFSQLELVGLCAANWGSLNAHCQRSSISLSRPVADRSGYLRQRVPYQNRAGERLERMHRARHTVVADISNFYGSIYTHSFEWALHTKAAAKASLKAKGGRKSLGRLLDETARCATEGQTKGLPIGPKTSLLLSELIVCAIDEQLQARHAPTSRYAIRMIDDFEFSAASRAEAEEVLFTLDSLLSAYELDLNPLKTRILDGPLTPDAPWRTALQQFSLRTTGSDQELANDIRGFFSLAFELSAAADPGDAVLTYAVSRTAAISLGPMSWGAFSLLLLAAATGEPSSLGKAHKAFTDARRAGKHIDRSLVSDALSGICYYHAPLEHGSEVAWSLNILRDLRTPLSSEAAARIAAMQDNCCLLLLMDMIQAGLIAGPTPSTAAIQKRAEGDDAHKSEDWLLAYECARLGWASDKHFMAQAHWAELLGLGVAFFNAVSPKVVPAVLNVPHTAPALVVPPLPGTPDADGVAPGTAAAEPDEPPLVDATTTASCLSGSAACDASASGPSGGSSGSADPQGLGDDVDTHEAEEGYDPFDETEGDSPPDAASGYA